MKHPKRQLTYWVSQSKPEDLSSEFTESDLTVLAGLIGCNVEGDKHDIAKQLVKFAKTAMKLSRYK